MFLYDTSFGDKPTFSPSYADTIGREESQRAAADALWRTRKDLADYRDNSNGEQAAKGEAYERRNKAIFDATGVQLDNPMKFDIFRLKAEPGAAGLPEPSARNDIAAQEQAWRDKAAALAREKPEFANVIGIDRPVIEDAYAITRGAEKAAAAAEGQADAAGLSGVRRLGASLGGGLAGALRDPLQVATLAAGGGISSPARALGWRLLESMFSEAAINGGIEAAVQVSSNDWKKRAGVDASLGTSLKQVGLAALFGGGFGGLLEGGRTVAGLLGRDVPADVLTRAASGEPEPGDFSTIADALGVKADPATVRAADLAAEQPALDAAAFGRPPEGLGDDEAAAMAAQALRAVDSPDGEARTLGAAYKQRLAAAGYTERQLDGMSDEQARNSWAALQIVRKQASHDATLSSSDGADWAERMDAGNEIAADVAAGRVVLPENPPELQIKSTRSNYESGQLDQAAADTMEWARSEGLSREQAVQALRDEVAAGKVRDEHGIYFEDLIRHMDASAQTIDLPSERIDPNSSLASTSSWVIKNKKTGEVIMETFDPKKVDALNTSKYEAVPIGDYLGSINGRQAVDMPVQRDMPLLPDGATPEPATAEAGELANLALTEARRPAAGEAEAVDLDSGKKLSVWDAMPAAKDADGSILHATHETMIADADRTEFFGDLIAACKD